MLRLMLLSCAFVGVTGGLIMVLMPPAEETEFDTVSRAQAAPFSLQPAIPAEPLPQPAAVVAPTIVAPTPEPTVPAPALAQVAPQAPQPAPQRPLTRPADLVPASQPAQIAPPPAPALSQPALAAAPLAGSSDEVGDTVNAIGLSIVHKLLQTTPSEPAATPSAPVQRQAIVIPTPKAAATPKPAPQPAQPNTVQYTVKPGDSLPGLAFRFFGTTAAYMSIVDANPVLAEDPQNFTAGMTLEIPLNE